MKITDGERNLALLLMVQSGAFPDDAALERWSTTPAAEPHLRRWLDERYEPRPTCEDDIDLSAIEEKLRAQDALAALIQAEYGPQNDNR